MSDIVFWWIVVPIGGLAGALALFALTLAAIYIAKKPRPAGAAPAAGAARAQFLAFVQTHWDKIGGTAAALLAVLLLIWMCEWMLPNWSAAYYKRGGWGYALLFPVLALILPALVWPGRVRKILLSFLGVFLAFVILPAALPAMWETRWWRSPVETADTTPPARQASDQCDGTKRTYTLSANATLINNGANCRLVEWGRDSAVTMLGANREQTFPAGPGGNFDFRATQWKCAATTTCLVAAVFVRN